jgi:hypothetical protein
MLQVEITGIEEEVKRKHTTYIPMNAFSHSLTRQSVHP